MSKIWAYSGTRHAFMSRGNGWDKAIPFQGLSDLVSELKQLDRRDIDTLAIVAHGDQGGIVELSPPLTAQTIPNCSADLNRLRNYLVSGAKVMFLACQVAS